MRRATANSNSCLQKKL